ncbi:hypothetical protein MTX26_23920 [Bradyrhizobium sp. ISRA443]|uniref:hypothetical protein n=1 Tax=unclassified Bradyrhizobium TaxID=2631580 RepID=UPI00247ACD33|nr:MULTISPECIES: hypothetical protein [unclassified Bradyrhizobium]WGR97450.1 hypothetical protein MTX23_23915 [Bradyrhizobium sp. ISRA436]WGS04338.1 hypothetical protein MTX18_23915 [Bradyrhizobium sp. ISRA437]WGS11222.1 hypothetical protein MTX26_23920 [Bradyrhizobium sp. ISRA443]
MKPFKIHRSRCAAIEAASAERGQRTVRADAMKVWILRDNLAGKRATSCLPRGSLDLYLRIPTKSPLRTEMIAPPDSDMMSPPGPVPLAMGLLALSRLSSIVL